MVSKVSFIFTLMSASMLIGCARVERKEVTNVPSSPALVEPTLQPTPDDFPSDEQFAKWQEDAFRPVIKKWLKGEHLPTYVDLDRKDPYAANSEHEARIELLDVNGDGSKELAMQSGCAAVGNCAFSLFQKTPGGYRQLLVADMVQQFKLRKARSKEYFDLETRAHGSATSGGIAVYRYDGSEYKIAECFGYEYESTGKIVNGQSVNRDTPTLTPADCKSWPSTDGIYRGQ